MNKIDDVLGAYFPYCLEKDGDEWVILNREYKPVGFNTREYIKYKDYPVTIKTSGLSKAILKKLDCRGDASGDRVVLYNDGCHPKNDPAAMKAYLKKIEILLKIKICA